MKVYKNIIGLIPKNMKLRSIFVLVLVFFGMILEMMGVGLIIPVFSLILDTNKLLEYPFFVGLFNILSINDEIYLIYAALVLLIFIYSFKAVYLSILSWVQAKFVYDLQASLSKKLFTRYIFQPYSFHLTRNSAYLIRNVTTETTQLVESAFLPMMLVINEVIVISGLVALMFFITPNKAIILFSIILLGMITIQLLTKTLLVKWGRQRQDNEGLKIKTSQEGLGGIKDIKVLGREYQIINMFNNHVEMISNASGNRNAVQQYPRIWIEYLGIISLIVIILLDIFNEIPISEIIPGVAFIAAIAFRIMPSSNRFLSAIQSIKFSTPVVNLITDELKLDKNVLEIKTKDKLSILDFEDKISIKDISFSFDGVTNILDKISIDVIKGEKIGIVGSSGAGKSTFVDLLLGLHLPNSGKIEIDGEDIYQNLDQWYEMIGYVPQSIFLSDDTLRRNIAYGLPEDKIDDVKINSAIEMAQLNDFVINLENGIDTVIGERGVRISGGQRQRIGIARALYKNPKLLILDEATSALDVEIEKDVMESIYSLDSSITILIIAHRLSTLDKCNRILGLDNGKINFINSK
jgi:ABC-type multidrug transport system fused ATPase/permease subunit